MKEGTISEAAFRRPLAYFVIATAALLVFQAAASAQTQVSLKSAIPIPNKRLSGFDISYVDQYSRVYVLASNPQVVLLDLNTNTASTIGGFNTNADPNVSRSNLSGPNGVATVNHIEAWAGDGPTTTGPIGSGDSPSAAASRASGSSCSTPIRARPTCSG